MTTIGIRDLRNRTSEVVARVQAGESIVITNRGVQAARLEAMGTARRSSLTKTEILSLPRADAGLRTDLERLGETTDELGPIE